MPGPIQIKRADAAANAARVPPKTSKTVKRRIRKAEEALEPFFSCPSIGPRLTDEDFYDVDGMPK